MSRMPEQVHIYLFRKNIENEYEFALFQRSENALWWQGICGGVEEGESKPEAARREMFEEAGVSGDIPLYRLESVSYLPVDLFSEEIREIWGKQRIVVPMYFFAAPYDNEIVISPEHTGFKWLTFERAYQLVYFHDQKIALWELKERLIRGMLYHDY